MVQGSGGVLWMVIWLVLLVLVVMFVSGFTAWLYIIVVPFTTCIPQLAVSYWACVTMRDLT